MLEFLKEKWIWIVGALIGLWVLLKLVRSGSSSAAAAQPTGTSVTYAGGNDSAAQVAQIQSQSTLAAQQIATGAALQNAAFQLHATESTNDANVKIAGIQGATASNLAQVQAANALAITNSNNAAAVHASDNQLTLGVVQTQAGYNLGVVQSNNQYNLSSLQSNLAYKLGINTNQTNLQALQNTNAAKLAAYGIQAQVTNNQTAALQNILIANSNNAAAVQQNYINKQAQLQSGYMVTQQQELNSVLAEVNASGGFNSQHGGANSTAAVASVLNPKNAGLASLGASSADSSIDAPQNNAAIIQAIGNAVASVLGGSKTGSGGSITSGLAGLFA